MNFATVSVLFCVAVCYADYSYEGHGNDYFAPANYKFEYGVNDPHTGDKKSQYESRHGDVVKGAYSINDPDGTVRVVEYTSDPHSGFNAVVKRIGHASHPQHYKTYNDAGHEAHHGGYNNGGYKGAAASSYASINNYARTAGHGYY